MKDIVRHALGVFFLFFFLLFLFVSAVQFEVLTPTFWTKPLTQSGVYNQITESVSDFQRQIDEKVGRGRIQLEAAITPERVQQTADENITRLLAFLKGKSRELLLFLPFNEWGLPKELVGQQFKNFSRETKLEDALEAFSMKPEAVDQVVKALASVQQYFRWMPVIWLGLAIIAIGLGAGYYLLDSGSARLGNLGFLLLVSGLLAGIIGFGGSTLGPLALSNVPNWPAWAKDLGSQVITEFFSLGKIIGLIVAAAGAVVLVMANQLTQAKKKGKVVAPESLKLRVGKLIAGVILGGVILILGFVGLVALTGGQVNFTVTNTSESSK